MKEFSFKHGVTHSGVFHCDEVMATAILKLINPDFKVQRVFKAPMEVPVDTIVYDIGGGKYDHHQRGGNGTRENGVPYSSAGLVWKDFGHLIASDEAVEIIDRTLIQAIDAIDNGAIEPRENPLPFTIPSVSSLISGFNPTWDSDDEVNDAFDNAVDFAILILLNTVDNAESKVKAKAAVDEAIHKVFEKDDFIMILDQFMPWQEYLLSNPEGRDIFFVIFPSKRDGYNVQAVPKTLGSFETRASLPEAWRGLSTDELRGLTGIKDITFVHKDGFIGGAETRMGAKEMAIEAYKANKTLV